MKGDVEKGLACLVKLQIRDTLIIPGVAGEEGKVMLDRSRGDEDIKVTDNLACPSQFPSDAGKLLHDRLRRRKHNHGAQEALKHICCFLWIAAKVDALINFSIGNQADSEVILRKR